MRFTSDVSPCPSIRLCVLEIRPHLHRSIGYHAAASSVLDGPDCARRAVAIESHEPGLSRKNMGLRVVSVPLGGRRAIRPVDVYEA